MREDLDLQALLDALRCPECSAKLLAKSVSLLEEIVVRPNYGWCATGRKPARS